MKRAYRRRYHYIYKTTCSITGKYYIGMHSTDDLNDGYVGSGKRLWYSINKHGKENHICEILEHYFTREWLRERETELVCAEMLSDTRCMNIKIGGSGGFEYINATRNHHEHNQKIADSRDYSNPVYLKKLGNAVSAGQLKSGYKSNFGGKRYSSKGIPHTEETKLKIKKAAKLRTTNSQTDTCWIYSPTLRITCKVKLHELPLKISEGWLRGRKKFVV